MDPSFSVIIPTFNRAEFLRNALTSVIDQTFQDFEIIVVDNESTDHTLDIIREFQERDSRIKLVEFKDNHLIGAVRNAGIRASSGKYVAFLDSDDQWFPNKLQAVSDATKVHPEVGLFCNVQEMVREGRDSTQSSNGPPASYNGSIHDYLLLTGNCVSTSGTVVSRQHLDEVEHFTESPDLVEDYDLWLKLSKACSFHFISEVLGRHNYHSGSDSANVPVQLATTLAVVKKHASQMQNGNRFGVRLAIRRRYAEAFYGAGREHHRNGRYIQSIPYYARTVWTNPLHITVYGAISVMILDSLLGEPMRRRIAKAIWPSSWPSG